MRCLTDATLGVVEACSVWEQLGDGGCTSMQHVASRCTRCEGYASIAFGLAQVDSVALAKTKGLLP